eukprot:scaffold8066_cov157-Isochrysis_galbana.AAC.2
MQARRAVEHGVANHGRRARREFGYRAQPGGDARKVTSIVSERLAVNCPGSQPAISPPGAPAQKGRMGVRGCAGRVTSEPGPHHENKSHGQKGE